MPNPTTREEAEENLEQAVRDYMTFCGHDDGLLIDWLIITAQHHSEDDGRTATSNATYGPLHQSLYRASGLIQYAKMKIDRAFNGGCNH